MPLVDTSTGTPFHDNYVMDGVRLWHARDNSLIPVGSPQILLRYVRFTRINQERMIAANLVRVLNLRDGQQILVVGDGFGWLQEELAKLLPASQIISTDTSTWVHAEKTRDETDVINAALDAATDRRTRAPMVLDAATRTLWLNRFLDGNRSRVSVFNEALDDAASRDRIKAMFSNTDPDKADWAITGNVLSWITDAEAQRLSVSAHDLADNVAHVTRAAIAKHLSETEPDPWNWKWIEDLSPTTDLLDRQTWYTTTSWKDLLPNDLIIEDGTWRVV